MGSIQVTDEDGRSGVTLAYDRDDGRMYWSVWLDDGACFCVLDGLGGMPLEEFLTRLGIADADVRAGRGEASDE